MSRDRRRERVFLGACETAPGFAAAVLSRLDAHGAAHGDSRYLAHGVDRLFAELSEEGLDLAGWSVLAAHVLDLDRVIDPVLRLRLLNLLGRVATLGSIAWALTVEATELLGELETES